METQKMKKSLIAAAGLAVISFTPVWGFTFEDIAYWVGEGTNRCAVVVDFNDGGDGDRSFAWGYRWNGDAPSVKAILDAITARDSRLKMFASSSLYGSYIEAFAYDADGDGGTFERVWNNEAYAYDFVKSDADDIFPATENDSYIDSVTGYNVYTGTSWMQLAGTGDAFEDVVFAETPDGVDITNPEDGDWICWRLCPYSSEYDAEWNPAGYECDTTSSYVPVAAAFRMDNIQYWVGQGTNSCAVVIDFNDGDAGNRSFAWGYRWNGDAPSVTEIMNEITANDPRLKMFASTSQYGSFIEAFAYDADGDGGTFERVWNANTFAYDFVKSDDDDIFPPVGSDSSIEAGTGNYVYAGTSWMLLSGTETCFENVSFAETPDGADLTNPTNGEWICWRICPYASIYDSAWNPIGYECDTDSPYTPVVVARSFRMDNIRFWLGSGTNECAIVIDFNDGSAQECSFAWGYRWNGTAPSVKAILDEITAKDSRLKMFSRTSEYGSFIDAFAYDADGDGGTFERVWNANTYAYDFVKSDNDDIFPALVSNSSVDAETGNSIYTGTSWMLLSGTEANFENVTFAETSDGADLVHPVNGEWICWRICPYTSIYDSDWNPIGYECDNYSRHVAVAAYPSETYMVALPKVGYSTYVSLDAAFDAARGGGSVKLPEQASVDAQAKTVTIGTAADETLQTYEVPAYFDMAVSGDAVQLTLNAAATPTLTDADPGEEPPFTVSDTTVTVIPGNVIDGLYYGLAVSTNLTARFSAPTEWVRAENGRVVLEKAKNAAASGEFYKVRVSDIDESAK